MIYARLDATGTVIDTCRVDPFTIYHAGYASGFVPAPDGTQPGWVFDGTTFIAPPPEPEPEPVPDPAEWLIDVGPFFDRFAAAKMPLLMSSNATVQALVKDLQVRKWIDLQRADVGQGIDALIALGVPGMTAELKTAILTTPVTADENFALRKVYFS